MAFHRRGFLHLSAAAAASIAGFGLAPRAFAGVAAPALIGLNDTKCRTVAFDCLHTGEKLKTDYWVDGAYVPDALADVDRVLRDFRTGDVHRIEPELLDLLNVLSSRMQSKSAFQVISGYRSPKTNAILRAASSEVAQHSLHMKGMAIDIRVGDRKLAALHDAALAMKAGGVGYYPKSDFVHVDVGRVRRWVG
jgi:uncharacterized protein YcbK (DUF882 family)